MSSKWVPRFMENPYFQDPKKGAEPVTTPWLKEEAELLLKRIVDKSADSDDSHGGTYTGGAGIAYTLLRASTSSFGHDRRQSLKLGREILQDHLEAARINEPDRETCYLLGSLSIYVICILYDKDGEKNKIDRVIKIGHLIATKDVQGDGDDELLAGRAGFLAAAFTLRQKCGEKIIPDDCIRAVINKMLESGRSYAASGRFRVPLMYRYHGRHYLGAAHGLAGILQMLLCFVEFLDDRAKADVLETVDYVMSFQLRNGNFPTKVEDKNVDRGENELVHWCHGATGVVHLLITAYLRTRNNKYLNSANAALNLIWQKGVLMKGPGICHGVAGSGYAFLLYYRLTGEQRYLDCARCFARAFCSEDFKRRARTPDRQYSLYEGIGGSLCFLCDLMEPNKAQLPLVPIPFSNIDTGGIGMDWRYLDGLTGCTVVRGSMKDDSATEIVYAVAGERYFANPYFLNSANGASKMEAGRIIEMLMRRQTRPDDYEGGPYVGAAGDGYSVLYAAQLLPEKAEQFAKFCRNRVEIQLNKSGRNGKYVEGQYLLGTLGVYVIKGIMDYQTKHVVSKTVVNKVASLVDFMCAEEYMPNGGDEMLAGRAGFLAAVLTLRMRVHHEIIPDERVKKVIDCIIDSGRHYAVRHRSPTPLMYQYYNVEYLGAAHGLMGILQMLLSFPHLLDAAAMRDIEATLDWLVDIQNAQGNFAPDLQEIGGGGGSNELIHWCHGATGAVPLMIVAYLVTKKSKFIRAAEKALNLIWERGVLRKGPGICHGVAGGGYAFLLYYRFTLRPKYLEYAKCFARIACDLSFREVARTPDSPFSLFEGLAGLLCLLVDLAQPYDAQFPMIPINFDQN